MAFGIARCAGGCAQGVARFNHEKRLFARDEPQRRNALFECGRKFLKAHGGGSDLFRGRLKPLGGFDAAQHLIGGIRLHFLVHERFGILTA